MDFLLAESRNLSSQLCTWYHIAKLCDASVNNNYSHTWLAKNCLKSVKLHTALSARKKKEKRNKIYIYRYKFSAYYRNSFSLFSIDLVVV